MADDVTIPHFDLPFRFGSGGGHAAVVQQDSVADIRNCIEACMRTQVGTRAFVPQFGVNDATYNLQPLQLAGIVDQIFLNEPRADVALMGDISAIGVIAADILAEVSENV